MELPKIKLTNTETEINACYVVMQQLRPHLSADEFLQRVQRQMQQGYRLVCLSVAETVCAVAGFRHGESLAWGNFLYIDDLVTDDTYRSQGYGQQLLKWLVDYAQQQGCEQLHLDSGIQRKDAHRFYERMGLTFTSHHYAIRL